MKDFSIINEGNIFLLCPHTEAAKEWIAEHIVASPKWAGSVVVEHRYIENIALGIEGDGLSVD